MAVFPFTVRATDSEGSYADRQFNITVRNSRVERYMIVDNNDAWTSPDGQIWTNRPQVGGISCAYGNGFWLILGTNGFSIMKSADGINYASIPVANMTFLDETGTAITTGTIGAVGPGSSMARLKFFAGKFWCPCWNASAKAFEMWSSPDAVVWQRTTLLRANGMAPSNAPQNVPFQYGEDLGTMFIPCYMNNGLTPAIGYSWGYGWAFDGTTWTQVKNINQNTSLTNTTSLYRINGMYFTNVMYYNNGSSYSATGSYHYSTDGINWTSSNFNSSQFPSVWGANGNSTRYPTNMIYANGMLYLHTGFYAYNGSNATVYIYLTSTDGLTWTPVVMKNFNNAGSGNGVGIFKNGVFLITNNQSNGTDTGGSGTPSGNGGFRVSVDGVNWTMVNALAALKSYNDIAAMS